MGTMARTLPDWTLTVKQYATFLPVLYPVVRDIIIVLTFSCVNHLQLLSNVLSVTTYRMSQTMILLTILQPLGTHTGYHRILTKLSVTFRLLGRVQYVCYAIATSNQFKLQTRVLEG